MPNMPKEKDKYQPPNPRRQYTIMSPEESNAGKKSQWYELEITGIRNLSPELWKLQHLTSLYLNDNNLMRIPPDVSRLSNLTYLDLSANKLRSLPAEIGDMVHLRELLLNNNYLRVLPYELGRLFQLQTLGLTGNPLSPEILNIYNEPNGQTKLLNFMLDNLHYGLLVQSGMQMTFKQESPDSNAGQRKADLTSQTTQETTAGVDSATSPLNVI